MLKKIQNYLLLNHPLLWNIKFVPVFIITVLINILFFISGYVDGKIDYTKTVDSYRFNDTMPESVVFLAIILSSIVLILWIVFYIRNNAFKTFYPKKKASLFKEWILILILCIINCSYIVSFMYAYELRARNYYEKEELIRRLDVISKASIFIDGGYERSQDTIIKDKKIRRKNFIYDGKTYQFGSLLNKTMETFSLQERAKDSITLRKIRRWLINNKKDSVCKTFKEYMGLLKEHSLQSSINSEQWLELVYNYPNFNNYMIIGNDSRNPVYAYDLDRNYDEYSEESVYYGNGKGIDLTMNIRKITEEDTTYFPKYYVSNDKLKTAYGAMSKAWTNPDANAAVWAGVIYFAIGMSMLLFSFRVTSGKSWLIAGIAGGIVVIITSLLSIIITKVIHRNTDYNLIINNEHLFLAIWVVIVLVLLAYYFITLRKKAKSKSAIVLNILIWLLPFLLPVSYFIVYDYADSLNTSYRNVHDEYITVEHPFYTWLSEYLGIMLFINLILIIVYMYFFTIMIKKWKGIAEA
ncbi:hypothetical protein [Flavobacterium sp. AG291]|uniref:hypothetical protein n=1 Tax=Flavobacterium sp. AG291 TaxID=2184000 RepID=UPI000E0B5411|nr:hypothetical protein [Flavobacterium sp. AG291]RDI04435.1 hypothetical protein DEU42_12217 [Flavobacterium sp. AG291]